MKTLMKRLFVILLIIFVPVFFVSLLGSLIIHSIWAFFLREALAEGAAVYKTAIFLYESYMSYLWWLLVAVAISVDVYFYMLKGYKHNKFIFYGLKAILVFIVLFAFINIFFQDKFAEALSAYQQSYVPHYIYLSLFLTAIFSSIFFVYIVHELHNKWILPQYIQNRKAKK